MTRPAPVEASPQVPTDEDLDAVLAFLRQTSASPAAERVAEAPTKRRASRARRAAPAVTKEPNEPKLHRDPTAAEIERLAASVPASDASSWDPGDDVDDVETNDPDESEAVRQDDDELSVLPDDLTPRLPRELQPTALNLAIEAAEKRRLATGFYERSETPNEHDGEDDSSKDEEPHAYASEDASEGASDDAGEDASEGASDDAPRWSRARLVRARTESFRRGGRRLVLAEGDIYPEQPGVDYHRPRTRADCAEVARPCPYVSCKYNLYLDVSLDGQAIQFNFPDLEPDEMRGSCVLDVAGVDGGATLKEVGDLMNITRERVRQIEARAMRRLRGHRNKLELKDFAEDLFVVVV